MASLYQSGSFTNMSESSLASSPDDPHGRPLPCSQIHPRGRSPRSRSWNRFQRLINLRSSACCFRETALFPAFAWASWSSRPRRGPGRHPPRTTPWGVFLSPQAHSGFTDRWPLSSRPTPHDRQGPPPMPRAEPVTAHPTRHGQHATGCYVCRFRQKFGELSFRRKLL